MLRGCRGACARVTAARVVALGGEIVQAKDGKVGGGRVGDVAGGVVGGAGSSNSSSECRTLDKVVVVALHRGRHKSICRRSVRSWFARVAQDDVHQVFVILLRLTPLPTAGGGDGGHWRERLVATEAGVITFHAVALQGDQRMRTQGQIVDGGGGETGLHLAEATAAADNETTKTAGEAFVATTWGERGQRTTVEAEIVQLFEIMLMMMRDQGGGHRVGRHRHRCRRFRGLAFGHVRQN